jgi:hypothetical protein
MRRADAAVLIFNLLYLGISAWVAARTGNVEFIFYVVVLLLLIVGIGALHMAIRLPQLALWGLSLWGVGHMLGGMCPIGDDSVLYNLWLIPEWLKYDQLTHAYGFGVATWICWLGMRARLADPRPRPGLMVLVLLAGMGLGAMNEVVEFAATQNIADVNVGGYANTGWDMVFNLIGCAMAVVGIWIFSPKRSGRLIQGA